MGRFVGKAEAEKIVLNYLHKQTEVAFRKFSPSSLTNEEIAKNTDLDIEIVDETLEALSEGMARAEKVQCNFEFWLPATEEGEKLKERLFERNMAFSNIILFSFIAIVALFYLLNFIVAKKWFVLTTTNEFFFAGVIITAISISIAKRITNRYYFITQRMREVKHYKMYVWSFIILTTATVYLFSQGYENDRIVQNTILYISILANIVTIIAFFVSLWMQRSSVEKSRKRGVHS